MFFNHPFTNTYASNAGPMVYRPLSHVGDDRNRGQGAPVAIWRDRSRRIAESDHGLRQHSLAGFFLPEAAVVSSEPIAETWLFGLCFGVAGMNICVAQQSWG